MRSTSFPKALFALALAFGVLAAACSSTAPQESTTTTVADDTDAEAITAMCRTLELLSSASVPPGNAAESIVTTDLDGLPSQEKAAYGDLLIRAPLEECANQIAYADEIAYWLGF
jgi:hypothetical protein